MLAGKRILVIEDEFLIALDVETELRHAGAEQVELAGDVDEAVGKIRGGAWDAAITDANLQGQTIERVVEALRTARIPFLILTGYGHTGLPGSVAGVQVLRKPFDPKELVASLGDLCKQTAG